MNPDSGKFEPIAEGFMSEELLKEYRSKWKKHNIKQDQIFYVGEIVELKGANYRVKSIHSKSIVLTPAYPAGE